MGRRSEKSGGIRTALIASVMLVICCGAAHADLIDALCDADLDPATVIQPLVEEAETTGIPMETMNRLLAVGYRNAEEIKALRGLLCTIIVLEERGLPTEPIFDKLEEGLGKRVPLAAIHNAIVRQGEKLQYAQKLVAGESEPVIDDINVQRIADLMDIGVTRKELDDLFGPAFEAPTEMRVVAAEIRGYGQGVGFPKQGLDRVISAGLSHRSFTREWAYFIKVIQEARRKGISDERTAGAAVATLSEQQSMNVLIHSLGLERKDVYKESALH